jgi:hypothetical protein
MIVLVVIGVLGTAAEAWNAYTAKNRQAAEVWLTTALLVGVNLACLGLVVRHMGLI